MLLRISTLEYDSIFFSYLEKLVLVGVFMGVAYGEVSVKVGRFSASISGLRLGWEIG